MSCANNTDESPVVISTPVWLRWSAVMKTIIAIHDAFREALQMRRDAHGKYPFDGE
jgi:hypothetical protein